MIDKLKTKFKLHYYLKDNSHAMNAFVRNKAEKDFLEAVKRIDELLDSELKIETEAYQEGGLIEILAIVLPTLHYLSPALNDIITHYATRNTQTEALDKKIKEATLQNLELDNQQKTLKLQAQIEKKLNDKLVQKYISNFYKKIDAYEKVEKIGYRSLENNEDEYIVERKDFKSFILHDDITMSEDDDAMIEIISPVLKEGKYNWRGRYKNEKIDFSMADSKFKQEVIEGKHKFSNGSLINCHLEIKVTFDEFGDEKKRTYRVLQVFGTQELEFGELKLREAGRKKQRKKWEAKHYKSLFDDTENIE
ncbi:hypothetical protein [Arcobacter sp. FWKO B]|uniref:hypothetical protein n=1 Tax=Arcobacter sp. FWKO B TaxID=2593672 RepID=UPI0018A5DED7|nr:hypothetical protein [Arcobacter sp. FWKO B]QOG12369.1 hypothetical protein FWKOB_06510 [Arcobacter sp. FWKO B]